MEFNKSCDEILKSVEELFDKIGLPTKKIYRGDSNWDKLYDYSEEQTYHLLNSGLTKFVLNLDRENNFVVKIPFAGVYYGYENEYEDYCRCHGRR